MTWLAAPRRPPLPWPRRRAACRGRAAAAPTAGRRGDDGRSPGVRGRRHGAGARPGRAPGGPGGAVTHRPADVRAGGEGTPGRSSGPASWVSGTAYRPRSTSVRAASRSTAASPGCRPPTTARRISPRRPGLSGRCGSPTAARSRGSAGPGRGRPRRRDHEVGGGGIAARVDRVPAVSAGAGGPLRHAPDGGDRAHAGRGGAGVRPGLAPAWAAELPVRAGSPRRHGLRRAVGRQLRRHHEQHGARGQVRHVDRRAPQDPVRRVRDRAAQHRPRTRGR